jgi:hypothetical protein
VQRRSDTHVVAYWWYISNENATGDHRRFLDSMALQGIVRGSNYGSFVRVSTPALPNVEEATVRLQRFSAEVMGALPSLFGTSAAGERR